MSNHYFQFKQFTIHQDKCAMKICTDSCLFGAWLNRWINENNFNPNHTLDIGAGTGLLSLMLAQGNKNINIDAVEIDTEACMQAVENVDASPFNTQISLHHSPLQLFKPEHQYDLIFSNPPFFENDLKSDTESKNLAKHSVSLTAASLIDYINNNLSNTGKASLLIPYHRYNNFLRLISEAGLFTEQVAHVKQSPKHSFFRSILLFSRSNNVQTSEEMLSIKNEDGEYSERFTDLLSPYYLKL